LLWLLVPVVSPLLAAGMPGPDDCACSGVSHHASDDGTTCRTSGFVSSLPISRTLALLLLLVLLLLGRLLGLRLGLGLR
jgi:hypothetical protein